MKKLAIGSIVSFLCMSILLNSQQRKKPPMEIEKAYVYKEASLLISESDLYCSFFINKKIPEDIIIKGAKEANIRRDQYTDYDELLINKGARHGLKEGDLLIIIEKGNAIYHPITYRKIGRYYVKKSLAKITVTYNSHSVITLMKGCNAVNIGDIAIPFKPEQTIFKRKIEYTQARIPESPITGSVVYIDIQDPIVSKYKEFKKELGGEAYYIAIDLGKAMVSKGQQLLFYKRFKKKLPPLIIGTGIVIHSENNNSTVKILDSSRPIRVGDKVIVLPEVKEKKPPVITKEEEIPILKKLEAEGGEQRMNLDILFDLDRKEIRSIYEKDLESIKEFISDKSEYVIILRGYTCSIGDETYNLELSQARVENMKQYLKDRLGIDEKRIETYFYGETESMFDNTVEAERRRNRLVKIEVVGK